MKVSVALCTYNGEKYIKEQLDSIFAQTLPVNEIIVCDDGSTDNTIEIIKDYAHQYPNIIKIFINEINLRSVKNFEKAIGLCTGDVIFLSDQDDKWVPEKVEEYLDYFQKNQNIKVIASNGFCIDENSTVIEKYAVWDVPQFLRDKGLEFDYFQLITYVSNIATGASMAFKREIIPDVFPFPIIKDFHHDEWIAIISSKNKQFELLNKKYFYYRTHESQQVGGVFFDKTKEEKRMLTEIFNCFGDNLSFKNYKKKLKRLCFAYIRNIKLSEVHKGHNNFFSDNCIEIKSLFYKTKNDLEKQHPIRSYFLNITDKILNKRQIEKISPGNYGNN